MRAAPATIMAAGISFGLLAPIGGVWWASPMMFATAVLAAVAQQTLP